LTVSRDTWLADRLNYLTASDVAPVLGLSPFKTREAVMNEKLGSLPIFDIGRMPRVAAGRHMEGGAITWVLEDRGWVGHQNGNNLRVSPVLPYLAATVDAYVETPWGFEIAECKNVKEDSKRYWKADGDVKTKVPSTILRAGTDAPGRGWAAPLYYWVQLQVQLHCTNKDSGWIVAVVGGVDRVDMRFERDRAFEARMLAEVEKFWMEKLSLERAFSAEDVAPAQADASVQAIEEMR
jgi:hypothetical protein